MKVSIEKIGKSKMVYMRKIGPYGLGNLELMEAFKQWALEANLLNETSVILGIAQDNPQLVEANLCRYDVALMIPEDQLIKCEGISESILEARNYMVIQIDHTRKAMEETYQHLFEIARKEKVQIDFQKPIIERYDAKLVKEHQCEICIPLQNSSR